MMKEQMLVFLQVILTLSMAAAFVQHPKPFIRTVSLASENQESSTGGIIRMLGTGDRAIVRLGVVLIAPKEEFHHFYRRAAIFIYAIGDSELEDDVTVVRGVILDSPTVFTLSEMMENNPAVTENPLGENFLFRGGDKGGDGVILLHKNKELGQSAVGDSGIYQGGWDAALEACAKGTAKVEDFKSFFNYCEFTEDELDDMLSIDRDGDSWMSVEVDSKIILNQDWDRGDCWSHLRNVIRQME
jgi:hypothetical protein